MVRAAEYRAHKRYNVSDHIFKTAKWCKSDLGKWMSIVCIYCDGTPGGINS